MSMLTLFNRNGRTLATDQLVYAPEDVGALDTLLEKIALLDLKLSLAESEIEQAKKEAMALGEQQGIKKGRAIAKRKIGVALLETQREVNKQRAAVRDTSVELALEIVRRIGLSSKSSETLLSLAMASARELLPHETASLCVHPDRECDVRERLTNLPAIDTQWLLEVVSDPAIKPDECVLKTTQGSLHVGLESQLRVIERSLRERIS